MSLRYLRDNKLVSDDMLLRIDTMVAKDVLADFGYQLSPKSNKNPLKGFSAIVQLRNIPEIADSTRNAKYKVKFSRKDYFVLDCFLKRKFLPVFLYGLASAWISMPFKRFVKAAFSLFEFEKRPYKRLIETS